MTATALDSRLVDRITDELGENLLDQTIDRIGLIGFDADGDIVYRQSAACHSINYRKIVPCTLLDTVKDFGATQFAFMRTDCHGDSHFTDADAYVIESLIKLGAEDGVELLDMFIISSGEFNSARELTTCFN